jgi:FixJ family two-component response regulator
MLALDTVGEIFIVDDDSAIRELLSLVFTEAGFQVTGFADGRSMLDVAHARVPASIILDLYVPGPSGLDILKELNAHEYPAPIFMISGHCSVPAVVDAIHNGATDFIEKPFKPHEVLARVRQAIAAASRARLTSNLRLLRFRGSDRLTPREWEVLDQIASGASNAETGRHLGISTRTVEVHRTRIKQKVGAKNAADLMRIVMSPPHEH